MDCLGQGVLCAYLWERIVLTILVQEDSALCGSTICDFGRGLCEWRKREEYCMRAFPFLTTDVMSLATSGLGPDFPTAMDYNLEF